MMKTIPQKSKVPLSVFVLYESREWSNEYLLMSEEDILKALSIEIYRVKNLLPTSWPVSKVCVEVITAGVSVDEISCSNQVCVFSLSRKKFNGKMHLLFVGYHGRSMCSKPCEVRRHCREIDELFQHIKQL